jgi:hypothetical protein
MKKTVLALKIKETIISRSNDIANECHLCPKEIYKEITGQSICNGSCAMEACTMLDILRMDYPPRTVINGAVDCGKFYRWFLEQQPTNFRIIKI